MRYGFVFPGQGSQYVGMGLELAAAYPEAASVIRRADEVLARPLSALLKDGPEEELRLTWNTQPAILTVSIACLAALKARVDLSPMAVAGHSLGEYSALVAAGAMTFEDAVATVEKRGRYMQEAVPVGMGAMYAILGLEADKVAEICDKFSTGGKVVALANDNSPGQLVISGHADAAALAAEAAKAAGAKRAVPLPVSAPFHCPLMAPAAEKLAADLASVKFSAPSVPVVANVDAAPNTDPSRIAGLLATQVASQVRWTESVRALKTMGVDTLVEIGPGKVLCGLIKRIEADLNTANVENVTSLDGFAGGVA